MWADSIQHGLGLQPKELDVRVIARVAMSAGDVCQFDLANSNASVTDNLEGQLTSGLANVIAVETNGTKFLPIGVCLQAIAAGQKGYVRVIGEVTGLVLKTSTNLLKGDPLIAVAGQKYLTGNLVANSRLVAIAGESATASASAGLRRVFFNGITGLGVQIS